MARRSSSRLEEVEAWWAFLARVIAFFAGMAILGYETLADHGGSSSLILAGIGLMGVPIAGIAEKLLARLPSGRE